MSIGVSVPLNPMTRVRVAPHETQADTAEFPMTFCHPCCTLALLTRGFTSFMLGWPRVYYRLLNLPLSILIKSKSTPADPAPELGLDTSRPVMYVLPYNSKADLLTLRAQCLTHDLPDPSESLGIDGTLLPRYASVHGGPRVFTYYTSKEESIELFHDYLNLHHSDPSLDMQMVPVLVMFGRAPGREKGEVNPPLCMLNGIQKFFAVL